jgi:VWFA-related protein
MDRGSAVWFVAAFLLAPCARADEPIVVFRSDVALVRVDAQVVDRENHAITGLTTRDFLLREQGRALPVQSVDTESLPIDLLFLLDVSASMRPHIERVASASHQAMRQLRDEDRVAIMVFDRTSRVRMNFRGSQSGVDREIERVLDYEDFRGGTDITRGLLDAADYIGRQGRREARRAIVIVTDDQTERERNEEGVERSLTRADAVLMALIAPDALHTGSRGYPGDPNGGVIFGSPRRRGGYSMGSSTLSAGTRQIARASGGDSMPLRDSYALQDTLARIRQRYAIYFALPPGARAGEERDIELFLADAALRGYPGADLRYRRAYFAPATTPQAPPVSSEPPVITGDPDRPRLRRRGVSQSGPHDGPLDAPVTSSAPPSPAAPPPPPASADPAWRRADPAPAPAPAADPNAPGWRKARPDEVPPK